jgi:hypothetical protein
MADDIVFIVQNKTKEQGRTATVKLFTDVTTNISHQFDNDVTEFAVERGKDITDNIRNRNNRFTVEGVVNDYALSQYLDNTVGYDSLQSRRTEMYNQLMRIRDGKLKFTLVTGLDAFESCVIKSFNVPVVPENASAFFFTIDIVQIREVFTSTVDIVVASVSPAKEDDSSKTESKGREQAKEYSVTDEGAKKFVNWFDTVFGDTGG